MVLANKFSVALNLTSRMKSWLTLERDSVHRKSSLERVATERRCVEEPGESPASLSSTALVARRLRRSVPFSYLFTIIFLHCSGASTALT